MKLWTLLLTLTLLLTTTWWKADVHAKKTPTSSTSPRKDSEKKLTQLHDLVHDGVVTFTDARMKRYVVRPARPYHLVLLFTALSPTTKCDMCTQVAPEFELLAQSYDAAKQIHVDTRDGRDVFFGVVDFDVNQEAFRIFELTSAPHLVYVAPDTSLDVSRTTTLSKTLPRKVVVEPRNVYNVFSQGKEAEAMATFVRQRTGLDIAIQRSKTFLYVLFVVAVGAIAGTATLVWHHLDVVLAKLRRKQLWMTVSLLFYGLSVSGMVFCIIRNPPLYAADRKGTIQYFHPQGRQQFVYEGLLVGGLDVAAAVFMILLSQWAVYVRNPVLRYLAIVGSALGFVLMYRQMTDAYKFKNRWYTGWMGF